MAPSGEEPLTVPLPVAPPQSPVVVPLRLMS